MFVQQFFVKGLAHSSYMLGGSNKCAIVDPRRDAQIYLDAARDMNMEITHILETHLHADFISGHLDLAEKTGAKIYAPKAGECRFEHVAVAEGDAFEIEDLSIAVLDTGGHTPEHITYVVTDRARGKEPVAIFCGDTLFVGDVGRPDLFPGKAQELAAKLYDNLHGKLMKLPDFCEVYPAHGAGSLCGRAMGAKRTSTIGYEKRHNSALQIETKEKFIASLTTHMPTAPDHFSRCSATNAEGPAMVRDLALPLPIGPKEFASRAGRDDTVVLDCRSYDAFGGQHVAGSIHVDFGGNFVTFSGWVMPVDQDILLVCDTAAQSMEATAWLRRVGLDRTIGYLDGGLYNWARQGLPTDHVPQLSAHELQKMMGEGDGLVLVDVRASGEFEAGHIEGAVNIPAPDLRTRHGELPGDSRIVVVCSTGHRSSLGASLLKREGFKDVWNAAGGMMGYSTAGFAPACPMCKSPHGPAFLGRDD